MIFYNVNLSNFDKFSVDAMDMGVICSGMILWTLDIRSTVVIMGFIVNLNPRKEVFAVHAKPHTSTRSKMSPKDFETHWIPKSSVGGPNVENYGTSSRNPIRSPCQ